jgi:hypothetical protein
MKVDENNWQNSLSKSLPERVPYEKGENDYHFAQLTARILGVPADETGYYFNLHHLYLSEKIHVLSEILDKTISTERFQGVQKVFLINQKEKGLSVSRFVAFLEGERLIPSLENRTLHRHIRVSLINVLEKFKLHHPDGLNHPDFRRFLVDLVKWSWNHLEVWLRDIDIEAEMPKVVWYGDASKSQMYFLYYLMLIGCDVVIFHPAGKDLFGEYIQEESISAVITYPSAGKMQPFPVKEPERQATIAYQASQEMNTILHQEDSLFYKPWQFRFHIPYSITLKTTYDEIFILAKEKAFLRPHFQATKKTVKIPALFAKIMGVSSNKKEYWDRFEKLSEEKNTEVIQKFPFTKELKVNYKFHYQHSLDKEGNLDPQKMIDSNWWQYNHLPDGVQLGMAHVISNMCSTPKLVPKNHETEEDVKLYLFTQASNIPPEQVKLVQLFDYSQDVPKLVLFNTEANGEISRSDAARLLFFNEIGIDIILYNPPGHKGIEEFIKEDVLDIHWLEEMAFGQELKEPSFIRKFLKSIKS